MSFFDETTTEPVRDPRHAGRRSWLILLMFGLIVAAAWLGGARVAGDNVPLGARVMGVPIGGLSPFEAQQRLRAKFDRAPLARIELTHDDQTYPLRPVDAGFQVDYAGTIAEAGGGVSHRSLSELWHYFTGGRTTPVRTSVDGTAFTKALNVLTRKIGRPLVEGSLDFSGTTVLPVYGHSGTAVDPMQTRKLIERVMFTPRNLSAELPVTTQDPYIGAAAVRTALTSIGRPAVSGPVRISIGDQTVRATPAMFAPALSVIPTNGALALVVDGTKLLAGMKPAMTTIGDKPVNAGVSMVDGRPRIRPAVVGASYDLNDLEQGFAGAVVKRGAARSFALHAALQQPKRTTADARGWGVTTRVGAFNLRLGAPASAGLLSQAARLNNSLVLPDRTLSLTRRLGRHSLDEDSSALASALFVAAWRAGYDVASRSAGNVRDDRFPLGYEVRLGEASDFAVKADSTRALLVGAEVIGDVVHVSLWSTGDRTVRITSRPPVCGSSGTEDVTLTRMVRREGQRATTDEAVTHYPSAACP